MNWLSFAALKVTCLFSLFSFFFSLSFIYLFIVKMIAFWYLWLTICNPSFAWEVEHTNSAMLGLWSDGAKSLLWSFDLNLVYSGPHWEGCCCKTSILIWN